MNPRAFAALVWTAVALNFTFGVGLRATPADDEIREAQRLASKGAFEDQICSFHCSVILSVNVGHFSRALA